MDRPHESRPDEKAAGGGRLKVTQTRGWAGVRKDHRAVLRGLGLGKTGSHVVVEDTPSMRGMIQKVIFMVRVEPTREAR